jgi:hypothetical protein
MSMKTWYNGNPAALTETLDAWAMATTSLQAVDAFFLREYHQCPVDGQVTAAEILANQGAAVERLTKSRRRESLLRSAVDSFCAMVVSVPSIDVTASGGTYEQRRSAELLGGFDDGVLEDNDGLALTWQCVVDACLCRVAGVMIEADPAGRILVRRVLPHHVRYNPGEGMRPRNLGIDMPISKSELAAAYPAQAEQIMEKAPAYDPDPMFMGIDGFTPEVSGDLTLWRRGWHLADPGKPESGRMVSMVGGIVLVDPKGSAEEGNPWPHTWFPFVPLRFDYAYATFGGKPAADTIYAYQSILDEVAQGIDDGFRHLAKSRIYVSTESQIDQKKLAGPAAQVIPHAPGQAPVTDRGTAPPPEYLGREDVIIRRCHDFLGLNYQVSRGQKADGISSAKGQREVIQLAQNRQVLRMQTVQNWTVAIAKTINATADAAYDGGKGSDFVVNAPGGHYAGRIMWSGLNFDKDLFTVKTDAINVLSRHPAARVEEVLELVQAQIIDRRQGLKAIANKDLQFAKDQAFAAENYAERLVDLALRGDYRTPDTYAGERGLQLIIDRGQERYLTESVEKQPSEYLDKLRDLIEAAKKLLLDLKGPPPTPAPAAVPPELAGPPGPEELAVPGAGLPPTLPAAAPPVLGAGLPPI